MGQSRKAGWSPLAFIAMVSVIVTLSMEPVRGLDDYDDDVTVVELSSDAVNPKLLARVSRLMHGGGKNGDVDDPNDENGDLGESDDISSSDRKASSDNTRADDALTMMSDNVKQVGSDDEADVLETDEDDGLDINTNDNLARTYEDLLLPASQSTTLGTESASESASEGDNLGESGDLGEGAEVSDAEIADIGDANNDMITAEINMFHEHALRALNGTAAQYSEIPADQRLPAIQTHALVHQVTKKLRLTNGMTVNIISNPDLESSAMAVSMEVGSWRDPDEALGMAHFIEHMLFMGTEQHPKPGNFDDFLSAHGAQISNAMTGSQTTTYAFATPHAAFKEGVERFSEFFTSPLFDSKGANKEMHAVNQEFEMHKDQDMYRMYHVEKELCNPAHPCSRFTIGNLHTLGNVSHEALISWYKAHYSANMMHIAVYTAQPIEQIAQLVAERFTPVVDRNYTRQNTGAIPTMQTELQGTILHVKPLTETKHLSIKWDMPSEFAHMKTSNPGRLVAGVLGDEGPNSLLALLQKEKLAIGLSAGLENSGRDNCIFSVSVTLSEHGMEKMNDVVGLVFRAIHQLSVNPIPKYLFDEAQLRDENSWKFQWRTSDVFDAAMNDAQSLIEEPIETYPAVQTIIQEFDGESSIKILKLLTPETAHLAVMGDKFDWVAQKALVKSEKYYHAQYAVTPVPPAEMTKWKAEFAGSQPVGPVFKIPDPNNLIPKALAVSQVNKQAPQFPALPQMVLATNDTFGELYLKSDDVFGDPYITSSFELRTDAALMAGDVGAQAKAKLCASLWVSCVQESLRTETYAYSQAGLSYGISVGKGTNLALSLSGMNPEMTAWDALLEKVLGCMTSDLSTHTTKAEFNMIQQAVARNLRNGLKSGPSAQASRHLWAELSNTRLPLEEEIKALNHTSYEDVVEFGNKVLKRVRARGFFYGQISGENGMRLWTKMKTAFTSAPAAASALAGSVLDTSSEFVSKVRVLPEGQGPFFKSVTGDARGNSTILVVDGGVLGCADKVGIEMLYKEVRQLFFNQLRTQQQTGYVAQTSVTEAARRTMAIFLVVSSWAGPADLLTRYNTFIDGVMTGLHNGTVLKAANFATIKTSMLSEFEKPVANIAGMAGILQDVVENYDGDFNVFKERQTVIKEMTIERIKAAAARLFSTSNTRRLAVLYSPDGVNPGTPPANYHAFTGTEGTFEKRPKYSCDPAAAAPALNDTAAAPAAAAAAAPAPALQSLEQDLQYLI